MQFRFETTYNSKTLSVMAKGLQKTVRKKRNRRARTIGWFAILLGLVLLLYSEGQSFSGTAVTAVALAAMLITLMCEDKINGWFAAKRMLKGTEKAIAVFDTDIPDSFSSRTDIGASQFMYSAVSAIAETDTHFVFALNFSYAQLYDKSSLTGGTVDEFRTFICERTGKKITPA